MGADQMDMESNGLGSNGRMALRLYIGYTHIWSLTGVQQGDSLGPLHFALILHPLVHKIKESCKVLLHAWYLDDGTVIGDSKEVANVLDITKPREGLFPVDIRWPSSGVNLLGGAVSRDIYFILGLAIRRVANAVDLMSLLQQLHDPQSELFLLRSCMSIAKLFFGLTTCQPVHMEEAALFSDKASRSQSWVLQDHILHDSGICGMDDDYVSALGCLRETIPSFDFNVDAICLVCCKACLDSFEEHAVNCKEILGFKYRHDMVRDVLFDICRRAGISTKKKGPMDFLIDPSDGRSTLRLADVLFLDRLEGNMRAWI
ncbi:hypothetical protein Tco_0228389 [Tanacetum coccineum]